MWLISKQRLEELGNTFNLHSNSTNTQGVWSFNQLYEFVQGRIRECLTLTYKPFHVLTKILYICLLTIDYLIGLALLGLSNWALICGLEWDQKGTNKTLALTGLGLFCQLLTSPNYLQEIFCISVKRLRIPS